MVEKTFYAYNLIFVISLIIVDLFTKYNSTISKTKAMFFSLAFKSTMFMIALATGELYFSTLNIQNINIYRYILLLLQYSLSPIVPYFFFLTKTRTKHKLLKYCSIPLIFNIGFSLVNIKTNWLFKVDTYNQYTRGPLFFLPFVFCIFYVYLGMYFFYKNHKNLLSVKEFSAFYIIVVFITVCIGIQVYNKDFQIIWSLASITLIIDYFFVYIIYFKFDALTGCLSRSTYVKDFDEINERFNSFVVILDMDVLKKINDQRGHLVGDEAIITIANILTECFNNIGKTYRIGGDEFNILCKNATEDDIINSLNELDCRIDEENKDLPYLLSISYGYAFYNKDGNKSLSDTVREADQEMYKLKLKKKLEENGIYS